MRSIYGQLIQQVRETCPDGEMEERSTELKEASLYTGDEAKGRGLRPG